MRLIKTCFRLLIAMGSLIPTMGNCQETAPIVDSLDLRIPVVDMNDFYSSSKRDDFLNTLYDAMSTVGFFAVRNTGVNADVIREAYAQAEKFFKSDPAFKATCFSPQLKGHRGFVPGETAKGNKMKDFKEFYHMGREGSNPPNLWPDQEGFKEAMLHLYSQLEH